MPKTGTNAWPWVKETDLQRHLQNRLTMRIQLHQPYGWGPPDYFIPRASQLGISMLPVLKWDRPRPQSASEWGDWHNFIGEAVRRYPMQKWWQVWNEPNNLNVPEWVFPDPASYKYFMADSARYMKSVNPYIQVIAGGIACGGHGSRQIPAGFNWNWFKQDGIVDRVAVQTYCGTVSGAAGIINQVRSISSQPVWVTELGRKASVNGEAQQADWFTGVNAATPTVPKYWFRYTDAHGGEPSFQTFGALRADWSARPVWNRLRAVAV